MVLVLMVSADSTAFLVGIYPVRGMDHGCGRELVASSWIDLAGAPQAARRRAFSSNNFVKSWP